MDSFSRYNQIQIKPEDQHKTGFICTWGKFAYREMPFVLKNARVTFQRAMTLIFHDLKSIIKVFLDDLAAHSRMRMHHPYHLRLVFKRCQHYSVRLNPYEVRLFIRIHRFEGGYKSWPLKAWGNTSVVSLEEHSSSSVFARYGKLLIKICCQLC